MTDKKDRQKTPDNQHKYKNDYSEKTHHIRDRQPSTIMDTAKPPPKPGKKE